MHSRKTELSEQLFFFIEKALFMIEVNEKGEVVPYLDLISGEIVNA
jgi:hypothetical protein